MKGLLIACCLLAATGSVSYAQTNATATPVSTTKDAAPTVSKADFNTKVGQLSMALNKNQGEEAKAKWDDVHKIMMDALRVTKYKIRDAMEAKNDVDQKKYTEHMMKQRNIYSETIRMKEDMIANKTKLVEKLNEFATTIL